MGAIRNLFDKFQVYANTYFPARDKKEVSPELQKRLEGFSYLYNIIWLSLQVTGWLILLIIFLFSKYNVFMQTADCCTADQYLFDNTGSIPLEDCSTATCKLYDFVWSGSYTLVQERPRKPVDGRHSLIYNYNDEQWCCNLSGTSDECCDFLPWRGSCAAVMWVSGFSVVVGMLMTQVILLGFYAYSARRGEYYVLGAAFFGVFLRLILFFFTYYLFLGFMFIFLFFWLAMVWCDNPYSYIWYKFGAFYVEYFFIHARYVFHHGFAWDHHVNVNSFIGLSTVFSFYCDMFFAGLYCFLTKRKDKKGQYLDLTYFDL